VSVGVTFTDRSREARDRYREAARMGVDAASNTLEREVKKAHNAYYTSQAFRSTAQIRQSIRRVGPTMGRDGWEARVGTNKMIALYWELGHRNLFTRKYERVRLWEPTAIQNIGRMRVTFARVVARMMTRA
jgi:hypothetical protein